jgi:predicted O-linked N-acetylglucosamine transferase (SPINDLY family)
MLAQGQGRYEEAVELAGLAIAIDATVPEFYNNLGIALQAVGRHDQALAALRNALRLRPNFPEAHNNLGNALLSQSKFDEAMSCYTEAVRRRPAYPEALHSLANVLFSQKRYLQSVTAFENALRVAPELPVAWNRLGSALAALGRNAEAVPQFERALILRPDDAVAHANLAAAYQVLGRHEEAVNACMAALGLKPDLPEAYCTLGDAYGALLLSGEAIAAYQEAIRLRPAYGHALNNLGNAYLAAGLYQDACACYERGTVIEPHRTVLHGNLATVYLALHREDEASDAFKQALDGDPEFLPALEGLFVLSRVQCTWEDLDIVGDQYQAGIRRGLGGVRNVNCSPFHAFNLPLSPDEQRTLVERVASQTVAPFLQFRPLLPAPPPRKKEQRLRIGYLSWDFRNHAVAHLLGHLFARHDRSRFEVIAYSSGPNDGSEYRKRIEFEAERFVDVHGCIPMQLASRIRADGVDILVDMSGHTTGSSPATLAFRPAPVQIHFLGYPGTIGSELVDYTFVDAVTCPPEQEHYFSEKVYRLADCYQINDHQPIGETLSRAAYGLPEKGFVFSSFNQLYKLTPHLFARWLRLLEQVPDSLLWLYRSNERAETNLRAQAQHLGCPQERIIFSGTLDKPQHLARLRHADLMLDTPVVNAMTTASDALWAGVPLLSVLGDGFADRVGASLLTAIGLPELIMPDLAAYEAKAVWLATHPEEMVALKAKLAANRLTTPLFDPDRFVRKLEAAYEELWTRQPPSR